MLTQSDRIARDPASDAVAHSTHRRIWRCGVVATVAWLAVAGLAERWPDSGEAGPTALFAGCMAAVGLALLGATAASLYVDLPRLVRAGPWFVALALLFGLWELASAKLDLLPRPFFATPQ
jgi:NitT/TauT family transport system permease protein